MPSLTEALTELASDSHYKYCSYVMSNGELPCDCAIPGLMRRAVSRLQPLEQPASGSAPNVVVPCASCGQPPGQHYEWCTNTPGDAEHEALVKAIEGELHHVLEPWVGRLRLVWHEAAGSPHTLPPVDSDVMSTFDLRIERAARSALAAVLKARQ